MKQKELKFMDYVISNQDIPGEKTLSILISGCDKKCINCLFPAQKRDIGTILNQKLDELLSNYHGLITCVCFMGGDDPDTMDDIAKCLARIRELGLKTAIFSGYSEPKDKLLPLLDYLKTSRCNFEGGPIKSKTTKQKLYKVLPNGELEDITYKFWKMTKLL